MASAFSSFGYDLRHLLTQVVECSQALLIDDKSLGRREASAVLEEIHGLAASTLRDVEPFFSRSGPGVQEWDLLVVRQRLRKCSSQMHAFIQPLQKTAETTGHGSRGSVFVRMETAAHRFSGLVDEFLDMKVPADCSLKLHAEIDSQKPGAFLVADDDDGNRDILSRFLKADGYTVLLAADGRDALDLARKHTVDLFLLDLLMPSMSGLDVLIALKRDPRLRDIPVIMISGVDEIDSVVKCIEMGAEDYVLKPFNSVLLRARIKALMDRKRLQDERRKKTEQLETAFEEIDRQKRTAEELLTNILPERTARELRTSGKVTPTYFEDVTIVFTDFVHFTRSTENLSADELVGLLNEYFTAFDGIVGRYGLEKLKTVGDGYIFVAGLPERTPSHPVDAVLAAMEMIEFVESRKSSNAPSGWEMRVGIHTGPVIAGVVGIRKFAFDIWGESVNFGSRMESSGAPNRINISEKTFTRVKDFFSCEARGAVRTKDGRWTSMFFVQSITPSLLDDAKESPPLSFRKRYSAYFQREPKAFPDFLLRQP